jgi:hypothetical protein
MSQTREYIKRLENLKEGERSRLRRLAGQRLDKTLEGFDLFTGLWWPLRQSSPVAPRRETSWLVAKLFGAFGTAVRHAVPEAQAKGPTLPAVLGVCEPNDPPDFKSRNRFRARFDALLCSPLAGPGAGPGAGIEPHLRWALGEVARAVQGRIPHARGITGIDWEQLLDHLSIWDRGESHRLNRDVRDVWAEAYLNAAERNFRP